MNLTYQKSFRLITRNDFLSLKDGSHLLYSNSVLVYYKQNAHSSTRLGISVTKKIGNAVVRNRFKRIIKEYFRKSNYKTLSHDILVVINNKKFQLLKQSQNFESILLSDLENSFKKISKDIV